MLLSVLGWRNNYIYIFYTPQRPAAPPPPRICGVRKPSAMDFYKVRKTNKTQTHSHHTKHPFPAFRVVYVSAPPRLSACVSVYSYRDGVFSMGWPSAAGDRWMEVRGDSRPWWRHLWLGQGLERQTLTHAIARPRTQTCVYYSKLISRGRRDDIQSRRR